MTASNRSLQWREQVIEPLWESRSDQMIMQQLADKLGFGKELSRNYKMVPGKAGLPEPEVESILREINKSCWTVGYTGQSPERLKAHMRNMHVFDVKTLKAIGGIDKETGYKLDGDYFGLPWPCYGTPELKHPGSPNLYDTSKSLMEGGGNFRANFGVERDGVNLLAEDGSHSKGAEIATGYPEFDHVLLKKLGWWNDLTDVEKKAADGKNWKTDVSGGIQRVAMAHGCHPWGNAKARAVVWNFPDPVPQHREPLYSTRPDLIDKYPTHDDKKTFWRMPTLYKSLQQKNRDIGKSFPLIMTSGRLVEYEGGGEETRSNPWLAELQQDMFVEINPRAANDRGIRNGEDVWVRTPVMGAVPGFKGLRVKALVTERVDAGTVFLPFHFSGHWGGVDLAPYYPDGASAGHAWRGREHRHHLRLRQRDDDAGDQDHGLPGRESSLRRRKHGSNEVHLRRRTLHRVQRLRHRLQGGTRRAVGRQPAPRGHAERRRAGRAIDLGGVHALLGRAVHGGVPGRLLLPHRGRRGAARQGHLHRLRLLLVCLPVRRAAVSDQRQLRPARQDGQVHVLRRRPGGQRHARPSTTSTAATAWPKASCRVRRDVLDQGAARRRRRRRGRHLPHPRAGARQGQRGLGLGHRLRQAVGWCRAAPAAPQVPPQQQQPKNGATR